MRGFGLRWVGCGFLRGKRYTRRGSGQRKVGRVWRRDIPGKGGKREGTVMIDDRCDLAAYMDGVWEAYMEFRVDGHSPHSRSLQNRSKDHTLHMTAQDLSIPFDSNSLLM